MPNVPHVAVVRYVFKDIPDHYPNTPEALTRWREVPNGVEVRIEGRSLKATGDAVKRLGAAMRKAGASEAVTLAPPMTAGAYKARWGDGWPETSTTTTPAPSRPPR